MMRWQVMAALALLCTTSGCQLKQLRTANQDLERENFQLEQRLDELTWQLEDAKAALDTCQRAACAVGTGQSSSSTAAPKAKPRRSSIFSSPSRQDSGPVPNADTEAPRVELPDEERGPSGARRPREFVPRFAGPPIISPPNPDVPEGVVRRAGRGAGQRAERSRRAAARGTALCTRVDARQRARGGRGKGARRRGADRPRLPSRKRFLRRKAFLRPKHLLLRRRWKRRRPMPRRATPATHGHTWRHNRATRAWQRLR